jgi:hypothetical protein
MLCSVAMRRVCEGLAMSKGTTGSEGPAPAGGTGETVFHQAEVLYALEWASVAPGLGGWNLLLDDARATRLISVVPPGAERPAFFLTRDGRDVRLAWQRDRASGGAPVQVGSFRSLRDAVLTLCPLGEEVRRSVNQSMQMLYPRANGLG